MNEQKEITYKDFSKLDIRIGKVVEAESVNNSNKLIKILFDFGDFKRQVIAGIGTKYTPEYLLNKFLPVIVNMQPRLIMGLNSQGMILAIGDKDVDSLLMPCDPVTPGVKVN